MERKHAVYLGLCAAVIGFALAFAFPAFSPTRVLWYYPLKHEWHFELKSNDLAMDWYGRVLLAAIVGAISFGAGYFFFRRQKASERTLSLFAAWSATALIISMSLFTYQLVIRHPRAEPLPSWYAPK